MLNRFFYFIFGFVLLGLCGCSALTGYTYEEYDKKTENIRLVFETPKKEIYLLGNYADYVFKDKRLFLFLDIISAKGFYTDDRIIMTVNSSSNVKLEIPSTFIIYKFAGTQEKQKIEVASIRRNLENSKIEYSINENNEKWIFSLKNPMKLSGGLVKLENHDQLLAEAKDKLVNVKIEAKYKLRHPVAQGMEEALFFFLTPVIVPIGMVIWGWNSLTK
ncbi:hypothetical protein [Fusobacterium pseudoperiodonticum]|uniref:hypothetical protein n=1 Tax=Fusobacterium pseudoperiodonticum TaxID=2663009 RepID=UPI000C1B2679|nr:hypothetical protein [Fusobacterium pseudoperiodonticum]ATV64904.1 hypothetical protein CTM78_11385 [Fusobacterium pseudoperiodonticum]PIM76905.1 hypothetical protein CTM69_08685 [Fusobacterium pseudoperiodonticum]